MADFTPAGLLRPIGGFSATCLDTARLIFKPPFQWRELLEQIVFIATVSILPAVLVIIPLAGFVSFILFQLVGELGAADLAGGITGIAVVRETGPIASVLVVAGAGATAICADLGSRTIREEIDAMKVLGINPIHRLVVPRVLASGIVALGINGIACVVGIGAAYALAVARGSSVGQYFYSLPLLTDFSDFALSELKALLYGISAGLVACHLGLHAKGGPKGVGEAVNQTVVLSFLLLFSFNIILSVLFIQLGLIGSRG